MVKKKTYSKIKSKHPDWKIVPIASAGDLVNCANCGAKVLFGLTHNSFVCLYDSKVTGLSICDTCYGKEIGMIISGELVIE